MIIESTLLILLCAIVGGSLATNYWLYRLWQAAAWKTRQLERALCDALPEAEYVTDSDIGWTDED